MKLVNIIEGVQMKFVLAGFMGAGKTTLQDYWREDFPGTCLDLDHLIAKRLSIPKEELGQWIEERGFPEFRKVESEVLGETLRSKGPLILALGGGAFTKENIKLIKDFEAASIWVQVDPEVCWDRVKNDENRPLVKLGKEGFMSLYNERESLYKKASFTIPGTYPLPSWDEFCKSYNMIG